VDHRVIHLVAFMKRQVLSTSDFYSYHKMRSVGFNLISYKEIYKQIISLLQEWLTWFFFQFKIVSSRILRWGVPLPVPASENLSTVSGSSSCSSLSRFRFHTLFYCVTFTQCSRSVHVSLIFTTVLSALSFSHFSIYITICLIVHIQLTVLGISSLRFVFFCCLSPRVRVTFQVFATALKNFLYKQKFKLKIIWTSSRMND
jgi:hypothetical protein